MGKDPGYFSGVTEVACFYLVVILKFLGQDFIWGPDMKLLLSANVSFATFFQGCLTQKIKCQKVNLVAVVCKMD